VRTESDEGNEAQGTYDQDETDNKHEECPGGDGKPVDVEDAPHLSGRRAADVTPTEIENAIVKALKGCRNRSCTMRSLTSRVLTEVGVRTRGNPRRKFERRVMRVLGALEDQGVIEKYKAKNRRVRLL